MNFWSVSTFVFSLFSSHYLWWRTQTIYVLSHWFKNYQSLLQIPVRKEKMEKRNETITAASDLSLCPRWIFHDQRSFFDGWICQRWRQLQTFESLNRGNCLTGLQQTSVMEQSERKQEASRKLQNQRGRRERDGRGTELIWSSWGHPNLKGPRTLLTQLCLEPGGNF